MLNPDTLKHLIIVGDEKQLPPIGPGRPFVDTVFHLKRNEKEANYIRLESNFRFDPLASMGILADLFGGDKEPLPSEIKELLSKNDDSLEVSYFSNNDDLKDLTRNVLRKIGKIKDGRIIDMFGDVFEDSGAPRLDRLQIITPRRVGSFGSVSINTNIVKNGRLDFSPRTKLICEENKYVYVMKNGRFKKMLALANGSVGYIMPNGRVAFEDLDDLEKEFGRSYEIEKIRNEAKDDFIRIERDINLGYAITNHKAQGSDYET